MADGKEQQQPVETPVARIVSTKARDRMVEIDFPVEYDGKTYTEIRIRRISGKELQEFFTAMDASIITIPPVVDCPTAVWEAMDADDQEKVEKEALDFFPRKLTAFMQWVQQNSGSTPETGDSSQPLSPTP